VEEAPTMNRDAGTGLLQRTVFTPARACQAAAPPTAPARSTLTHVGDEDTVIVDVGPDRQRTGSKGPKRASKTLPSSPEPPWAGGRSPGQAPTAHATHRHLPAAESTPVARAV
jgi:hypothetical protein